MQKKLWWALFSLLLLGCNEDAITPDLGLDYYPISAKVYRIYEVSETTYLTKTVSIDNYQIRETIVDSISNGNVYTYILKIEKRHDVSENWRSIETVGVRKTNNMLEYRKGNVPLVKMTFPVREGRIWDGNSLNQEDEATYYFKEVEAAEKFDDSDHIKVVISELPPNIVEQDERYEIYARGIGLVERNFNQIQFCQQGCSDVNEPEDGVILVQKLIEIGSL